MEFNNPIISGYNPDPSICRVGEDFYLVTSTFEFFPGVPIYHSKNLINWKLINYCLTDEVQLPLDKCKPSGGIFAPTIRYNNGVFYMTTTNVSSKGNFIVHTKDIYGKWSKPVWIDQSGIDPSLLFADEKVYFTSTSIDAEGKSCIALCEIDPITGEKHTESKIISYGCGGKYVEAPHLYKLFNKYYLMVAEGGTEYGHMETIQVSNSPYGPFIPCPHNPIVTNRNDMKDDVSCTGHADIVDDINGNWWLVCLGVRKSTNLEGDKLMLHHLGRETFLTSLKWENEWPVVHNDGVITILDDFDIPTGEIDKIDKSFKSDFNKMQKEFTYIRNPKYDNYILDGNLTLKGTEITLSHRDTPTFLGIRQVDFYTETMCKVKLEGINEKARVGITTFYNESYHYEIYLTYKNNEFYIEVAKQVHDIFVVVYNNKVKSDEVEFKIKSTRSEYQFFYKENEKYIKVASALTIGLATETTRTMTFTGTFLGMFAENANGVFSYFNVNVK